MNEQELINKTLEYIKLFEKGYCKDCNELCVIDNFPNEDLKQLLTQWIELNRINKEKIKSFENTLVQHSNIFYKTQR